jgi:hypothetical protein
MQDLHRSDYTNDLFMQYKKQLGGIRYKLLIEAQKLVVPERVSNLLDYSNFSILSPAVPLYKFSRLIKLDQLVKSILLPSEYRKQISELDVIKN